MRRLFALLLLLAVRAAACDLCAVYRAGDPRGAASSGFVISVAEQFIPHRTTQFKGDEVHPDFQEHVDSSITHLVAGYNFTARFGLSLNVPLACLDYRRQDRRYYPGPPFAQNYTESGTESGLGDVALIARVTVLSLGDAESSLVVNVLAGVKFPTGDDSRLDDEVDQERIFNSLQRPGTPHEPLSHSISSVHQSMLALGSGSYDGIFGLTVNGQWRRWLINAQFQYYLRTEGDSGYTYGDEIIVSGGPGLFVIQNRSTALGLQANLVYDERAKDEVLGKESNRTGSTAWYLGPLVTFGWRRLSANLGVDVPLQIENNWLQTVPDYRLHGGVSWRF